MIAVLAGTDVFRMYGRYGRCWQVASAIFMYPRTCRLVPAGRIIQVNRGSCQVMQYLPDWMLLTFEGRTGVLTN